MTNYPGDTITLPITYKVDGVLTDPTSVKISVIDPLGETLISLATATHDSTGTYHYDYTFLSTAITGNYTFTWSITVDTVVSTHSQTIELDATPLSAYYADKTTILNDMKAHLKDWQDDDTIVDDAISTAQQLINGKLKIIVSLTEADFPDNPTEKMAILTEASNLMTKAVLMDGLYTTKDKRSPSAESFERQSDIVLQPFTG
jgi:hypothetical protein